MDIMPAVVIARGVLRCGHSACQWLTVRNRLWVKFKHWLAAPHFEDGDRTRAAALLNSLLLIFAALAGLYLLLSPFIAPIPGLSAPLAGVCVGFMLSLRWLSRRGGTRLASGLLVGGLWALLTAHVFFTGGLNAPGFVAFTLIVLAAGLLLGEGPGLLMALLSALAGAALYAAQLQGWLPNAGLAEASVGRLGLQALVLLGVAGLLALALGANNQTVTQMRHALADRQRAEHALRESETRYRVLFESNPQPMWVYDLETLSFLAVNEAAITHYGYTRAEFLAMTIVDIRPPEEEPAAGVWRHRHKDGTLIEVEIATHALTFAGRPAKLVLANNVTERRRAESALRDSEARYRALAESAQRQARELALLDRARSVLARAHDLPEILHGVVEAVAEIFGYTLVSLYLREGDELRLQHQVGYAQVFERIPLTRGISGQVARTGQPVLVAEVSHRPDFLGAIAGITSEVCVPLHDQQQVAGILNVESVGEVRLTEADLRLLTTLGEQISLAIERARLYTEASANERRFRALIENGADAIAIVDDEGLIQYASPSTSRVVGFPAEEHLGTNVFERFHPEDRVETRRQFTRLLEQPGASSATTFRYRHQDGSWHWIEATATNLLAEPSVRGLVVNYRDVTDRKRAEDQLVHDAFYDALTGLPNRALLLDRLAQALRRAHRRDDYAFAVLLLDIDRFKVVNDSLGHSRGDELLVAIAQRVTQVLRAADTFARLSGDEFVILLDDVMGPEEAALIAQRVQAQLARPFDLGPLEMVTSASIGIVLSAAGHEHAEEVLRDADIAMYRAKALGKARHEVFQVGLRAAALERLGLEADLRRALEREELRVAYQPIIDLRTDQVLGFEALIRWQHPQRGLLAPAAFVPVAEDSGLIIPIDRWMLQAAGRQIRAWQARFPAVPPLSLNVNLSGRHFTQPDLAQHIEAGLRAANCPPASVRLEITESVIMENIDLAAALIKQLHALGVQIEIDDFGMGYSSLGYLAQLAVDTLKIDRRFVDQLSEGKPGIVQTIVGLARHLGTRTIAEGVETEQQRAQLIELGCDAAQGYLFSSPMDSEAAAAWLERQISRPALP